VNKSILLIGNTSNRGTERLKAEAENLGIKFETLSSHHVELMDGKLFLKKDNFLTEDFMSYDTYFFRGIGSKKIKKMEALANFLVRNGKRVVEKCLAETSLPIDKFVPESATGLYSVPKSILTNKNKIESDIKAFTFPVVAKVLDSSMGRGVEKINNLNEALSFADSTSEDFLLQEYFEINYDTRVLVVGGKVLGGFNRFKVNSDNFLTTARGGKREVTLLSPEQIESAIESTKLQGLEISGVDMFIANNQIYIIEVNASPQFRVFEKITGVNVAQQIIEYIS
jgi:RimK family alpha-L-glutamate ligase